MPQNKQVNTGLFIRLLGVSVVLLIIFILLIAFLSRASSLVLIITSVIAIFGGLIFVTLAVITRKHEMPAWLQQPLLTLIKALYPVTLVVGRIFGKTKDEIRGSFIAINNWLAELTPVTANPDEILLLLPHCIQNADCQFKVTNDIDNCRRCGKCLIDDIIALRDKYGFHVAVATGGTLARRKIIELKPKVVVAVACERDLASGIQDMTKIHVVGVTNQRPNGPCYNTSVDIDTLEQAITNVIKKNE